MVCRSNSTGQSAQNNSLGYRCIGKFNKVLLASNNITTLKSSNPRSSNFCFLNTTENSTPTLTVVNGTTITLEHGQDGTLIVELNDADAGDTVELLTAE